ncbi:glutathione S-transferase family protein [Acuticoccus mangrovi]|uniref:Glutathione S-transferase family protein n=1 Tax=Acuticoccus mangrovi TaxID=2796142 RepID=A0A934MLM4_9HYPH|nr:glutathione S-transferase family protein [Acuticoccus mangrovi]MBJ3776504.1 glutathione S-transferase family protein [Acuticoccus mangrovi]
MGDLILYTNPLSRGRTARWMLEEIGADYSTVVLDYDTTMKAPEYLAVNPMGKVPALRHHDTVVTELAAICAYLADAFPDAGLAPPPGERGAYYRWLFFAAGPLEAAVTARALHQEQPDKERMLGYGTVDRTLDVVERALSDGPYLAGDHFTAADLYLGAQITFGILMKIVEPRPAFTEMIARMTARPAYVRARSIDDSLAGRTD